MPPTALHFLFAIRRPTGITVLALLSSHELRVDLASIHERNIEHRLHVTVPSGIPQVRSQHVEERACSASKRNVILAVAPSGPNMALLTL